MTDDDVARERRSTGPGVRDLLSLGGMLVACIVAGVVVGLFVDTRWGSAPNGVLVGTGVGILAAGVGFWIRVRSYLAER